MSKPTSEAETRRRRRPGRGLARLARARRGAAAVEFAFIVPLVIVFTVGLLEFGLILFEHHRAGEATRRGLRTALLNPPLASLANLDNGPVTCEAGGGNLACDGGALEPGAETTFEAMVETMTAIMPDVAAANVRITYTESGLDGPAKPGVVTPVVSVALQNVTHTFFALSIIPGFPAEMTFPEFSSSALGPSESAF